ncbi:MAG: CocE/NonD family hydrolase [Flammeovirgaceae bacterium]
MIRYLLLLSFLFLSSSGVIAQVLTDSAYIIANYDKFEYQIPMRDGVKLFTAVYAPKDQSKSYPFLMQRTPYSVRPYGANEFKKRLGPSSFLMRDGYIFVYQDVRGRWMSEGTYDNMRPNIKGNNPKKKKAIDESSDTYDTIEWLLKNVKNHNGRVGQWGISYPGHYTASALPDAHPALVASSPQAPIADFFFDDFHHMGAFLESYTFAYPVFGHQTGGPTKESWYSKKWDKLKTSGNTKDAYEFFLEKGPLKNMTEDFFSDNFFWQQVVEHPNYDEFWQARNILPHLKGIDHAVLTVGGWFDAEDLYGPLNIYKTIEKENPKSQNRIVMGPWSHGDWARERGYQAVNHIYFGDSISTWYQKNIEYPFFTHYLKGEGEMTLPDAYLFDTGIKKWAKYDTWPSEKIKPLALTFGQNGQLFMNGETNEAWEFQYISDPAKPVPYRSEITRVPFTPRAYMTDDQRHASYRPDVLTFSTHELTEDMLVGGEIQVELNASISTTDADFIVKLIDVYPADEENTIATPKHVRMAGYQQLVRAEVFRGRFRNSFEKPEPFTPNKKETILFPLQDILHTFKKGHKLMIQVQSTWFPYIDRNPQKYVDNIYKANEEDFIKSTITIYGDSKVTIGKPTSVEK